MATTSKDDDALTDALAQTAFVVMGALTRVAAEHDMSLTQLRVFGILRDREPRMTDLAAFLGLEKSTMSGLIARAEQRGLVQRRPNHDDSRATDVAMTKTGLALAKKVHNEIRQALAGLTDQLNARDRQALAALLGRLVP